jgi:hypothetical protein
MLRIGAGPHPVPTHADHCTKAQENSSSKLRDLMGFCVELRSPDWAIPRAITRIQLRDQLIRS